MTPHVLIAGGGVAGLETLLALRALTRERVGITLLAPELSFVNESVCVQQPFGPRRVRGIRLAEIARDFGARWQRGCLARVDHRRQRVITTSGDRLDYDSLVLAVGAGRVADYSDALVYRDGRDGPDYRLLLRQLYHGQVREVAFVRPAGPTWLLPIYDLALRTAAACAAHGRSDVKLSLITPEEEPVAAFGKQVSQAVRRLLADGGITLYTSSYAVARGGGRTDLRPTGRAIVVDRTVTEPRLFGRRVPGVPFDRDTFIPIDSHGRVRGVDNIYAAGDATNFPLRQGGLAAQQADAVAEAIAASFGVDIEPQPFRPILRSVLLTGAAPRYLRADISGRAGDDSTASIEPLWWPPRKLAARYLAPYLSSRTGAALDVHIPIREPAVEDAVGSEDDGPPQLADLPSPLAVPPGRLPVTTP